MKLVRKYRILNTILRRDCTEPSIIDSFTKNIKFETTSRDCRCLKEFVMSFYIGIRLFLYVQNQVFYIMHWQLHEMVLTLNRLFEHQNFLPY